MDAYISSSKVLFIAYFRVMYDSLDTVVIATAV